MAIASAAPSFVLRDFDRTCPADIDWVVQGMHLTLVEVEGEKGRRTWPLPWAREMLERPAPFKARVTCA